MRDNTKMVALGRGAPAFSKSQIQVFSPAGDGLLLFSVDIMSLFRELLELIVCSHIVGSEQDCQVWLDSR